jgi:molybdopterin-containing oxidoreductase family membrane subunit
MWWMGVFYGGYLMFLLVECWSIFWVHPRIHRWACIASSATALVAPTTLGAVFGVMAARPWWAGIFTPLLMLASGFVAGTALLGIVFWAVARFHLAAWERGRALAIGSIRLLLVFGLVLVGLLVGRQLVAGLTSTDPGMVASTKALLEGPLAIEFVGARLIGGLLLPFVLLLLPWRQRWAPGRLFVASVLSLGGVFMDRLTFVSAAQIAPTWTTSGVSVQPYTPYSASLVEIGILIGAAAVVAFVYTLAERYLDLRESELHASLLPKINLPSLRRRRPMATPATAAEGEA